MVSSASTAVGRSRSTRHTQLSLSLCSGSAYTAAPTPTALTGWGLPKWHGSARLGGPTGTTVSVTAPAVARMLRHDPAQHQALPDRRGGTGGRRLRAAGTADGGGETPDRITARPGRAAPTQRGTRAKEREMKHRTVRGNTEEEHPESREHGVDSLSRVQTRAADRCRADR